MSGGLAALLDDIATMAKLAAASVDDVGAAAGRASAKAAGVVVDDTAVTPRYAQGFHPSRELPIVKRIAIGSLRNKLLMIVPAALLLSQFLPWLVEPLLMLGGTYLSYEGAEKVYEKLTGHGGGTDDGGIPEGVDPAEHEKTMTAGAIRTDFILSSEIIVIALKEVTHEPFVSRALILVVVSLLITALVYGVVGLIVKLDDLGLHLAEKDSAASQSLGRGLVKAMPRILAVLSTVGIAAMLWVGGHILLVGSDEVGWHWPYEQVHHLEESVHDAAESIGAVLGWLTNTAISAVIGLVVGFLVVGAMHLVPGRGHAEDPAADAAEH
jgi:predicted DNA repair protein MutK